jgi:hypothetical protein
MDKDEKWVIKRVVIIFAVIGSLIILGTITGWLIF